MKIFITGGASGLGAAITKKLAVDKTNLVYFTYFNSGEITKEMEKKYKNTKSIHCNFSDEDSIAELLNFISGIDLDVLINNAITGIIQKHFHKIEYQLFAESFNSNIIPVIRITQKCIEIFRKKKSGKIISILTDYLINTPPVGMSEYVANKAYLESLSKSWAVENIKFGITSNCISPSIMLTNLTRNTDNRVLEQIIESHPLKRLLIPEEVAETVKFLINCSAQINGANIIMNAGKNIK
jgi:NAD(P)-dependent dehydrogenase (short-subunit alcohol dehydrogenase family)